MFLQNPIGNLCSIHLIIQCRREPFRLNLHSCLHKSIRILCRMQNNAYLCNQFSIKMNKLSVIIAVYNNEAYIEKCARSLLEQTLEETEYIFIDDASTDGSLALLQEITKQFPLRTIRIIRNEQNRGIAAVRNIGLAEATGEYITYCDSDDWMEADAYRMLYTKAKQHRADIAACDFIHEYVTTQRICRQPYSDNMQENMRRLLDGRIFPSLWASIFRRQMIIENSISFENGLNMGEDLLFNVKAYHHANMITVIHSPYYHYIHTEGSVCTRRSRNSINSDIAIAGLIKAYLTDNHLQDVYHHEITFRKFFSKLALIVHFDNDQDYREWLGIYPETHREICSFKQIEPKLRLQLWLAAHHLYPLAKAFKALLIHQNRLRKKS